jgi:proteasome lid subunit RPN8/RPN11
MLFGLGDDVEAVVPVANVHETPKTRYEMDKEAQFHAFRRWEYERGLALIGVYHSHPETEPTPSRTDKRLAIGPDTRYIIVSLMRPGDPEVRAWRIIDKTDEHGRPVEDGDGNVVRQEIEEDLIVS